MKHHIRMSNLDLLQCLIFMTVVTWITHGIAADFQLSWNDNSSNESGFHIERKTGTSGTFSQRATVGANVTTYVDAGLPASTTFCYRVRAYNSAGNSAYTPEACKTTPSSSSSFNFSLANGGNISVTRGQSVSNTISATLTSGSSQSVSFSTSGLPSGASASYSSSSSCSPTCSRTLNISTSSSTATGTYSVTVTASGGGVSKSTTFSLTVNSTSSSNLIALEAESGSLTSPMTAASDGSASGGRYVHVPEGRGSSFNDSTRGGPGEVRFSISIPSSGTYALWARTIAPNGSSDSFYVTRNNSLLREWTVPASTSWRWNRVGNYSFSSGSVTIGFRQREDGTKLDQIILSRDTNYVPGQSGSSVLALAAAASEGSVLTVNVVKSLTNEGSSDGKVTSSPAGIDCGSDCQNTYTPGTVVQLTATPATGSSFAGWTGDADCRDGTVTVNESVSCIATFSPQTRGLHVSKSGDGKGDVQSSPSGISCGDDCSEPFANGTLVTLTASAAKGSIFKGWSGGGCGTNAKCTLTVSGSTSVQALFESDMADHGMAKVGVYRPGTGEVFLDRNGNGDWDGCAVDLCAKWLAQAEGMPVAGDWDGSGATRIGTFDSAAGQWYLDNNGNARWDGCGTDICLKSLGDAGDIPVITADSAQRAVLGFYRPGDGIWRLDTNANHEFDDCAVDACYSGYSRTGAFGLAGDWDGDGRSEIGTFDPDSGDWRLDYNGNGARNGCRIDRCYSGFGQAGDIPVAGDWDGSGKTKIGVFRPATGEWFLDKNGNGKLDACSVDVCIGSFGRAGDRPLVGKW